MFYNLKGQVVPQVLMIEGYGPGTTLDITLRTDTIVSADEEPEELQW